MLYFPSLATSHLYFCFLHQDHYLLSSSRSFFRLATWNPGSCSWLGWRLGQVWQQRSGFTFVKELTLDVRNVVASPKQKTSVPKETTSTDKDSSAKSEKVSRPIKSSSEKDLLDHQHENGTLKCPPDSPARRSTTESHRSSEFWDSPFKETGAENSPHAKEIQTDGGGTEAVHSGDIIVEPGWGTFDDTHYECRISLGLLFCQWQEHGFQHWWIRFKSNKNKVLTWR